MRGVRIAFLLALGLVGVVPRMGVQPSPGSPAREGPPRLAAFLSPPEVLAVRLRAHGDDPRRILFWNGYPLRIGRREWLTSGGTQLEMVLLLQTFVVTPGDYVERYVLLDHEGGLQDVATLHWPSRRRFEIDCTQCPGDPSEGLLEIVETMPHNGPSMLPVPYVELGVELGRTKRVALPWTGTRRLGRVWIEGGRFKARGAD